MKYIIWGSDDTSSRALENATRAMLEHKRPCSVEIQPYKPKRNDSQNALLWSLYQQVIEKGGESMGGWTKTDLHEYFLGEHFGYNVLAMGSAVLHKPIRRSSKLSKTEFAEFVDFILRRMAEFGIILEIRHEYA